MIGWLVAHEITFSKTFEVRKCSFNANHADCCDSRLRILGVAVRSPFSIDDQPAPIRIASRHESIPFNACCTPPHFKSALLAGRSATSTGDEELSVQVEITTRHGSINDDVQTHIREKSEKLLTYFERVTAIQVTVDFEGGRTKVEVLVDAEHKHNFVAHDQGDSVIPTFDSAIHKMEQQIRKYKEKVQDHRRAVSTGEASVESTNTEE